MNTNDLKPCPFCGSQKIILGNLHIPPVYFVYCDMCGVHTKEFKQEWGAIYSWNKRIEEKHYTDLVGKDTEEPNEVIDE